MPSYVTPKKNTAFVLYCGLTDQSDVKRLKANPTLAAGDVKVSIDGGAFANITTLPTVTPAAGTAVKVQISSAEMNGDNIVIAFIDQAGAEWCDLMISIQTSAQQIDDLGTVVNQVTMLSNLSTILTTLTTTGSVLTLNERIAIADQVLKRDWTAITGEADRSALNALRFLRNAWAIANQNLLTVTKEDDTTTAWSKPVTTEARNPVNSAGADV